MEGKYASLPAEALDQLLNELENRYAELFVDGHQAALGKLWKEIQEIRRQKELHHKVSLEQKQN